MYHKPAFWLVVLWEDEEVVDRAQVVDSKFLSDTVQEFARKSELREKAHLCTLTVQRKNYGELADNCETCKETCEAACNTCDKEEAVVV